MEHPKDFAKGLSIGIIMDGNGRWAKSRGLPRTAGHKKGAQVFQDIANYCDELGVESVYFYAFSTENWKRPAEEVGAIPVTPPPVRRRCSASTSSRASTTRTGTSASASWATALRWTPSCKS